jgi:hypothetical protein
MFDQMQVSRYWLNALAVGVSVSAAGVAGGQNAYIRPRPAVHLQNAIAAAKDDRAFNLTVINMSGQRRQVMVGTRRLDLPIGEVVVLKWTPGDLLHVTSDTDSHVNEEICVSPRAAARVLVIP